MMSNIYLLYGKDKGIINNELNKILNGVQDNDIVRYSLDSISVDDIVSDISMVSMFGSKRIVIVDNAYFFMAGKTVNNLDILEKYLNGVEVSNYLIFTLLNEKVDTRKKIYKLVKNKGKIIECNNDNNYIISFVKDYLSNNNYRIDSIDYFLSVVGNNLDNISNELDKLFMYKVNDKNIVKEDIDFICVKVMEDEIFSLTDAIILNDTKKAIYLLGEFLNKNYDEIYILNLLANQFRFLYQVKRLSNKGKGYVEIANILEVNPYRVKFTLKKVYSYTEQDLIDRIKSLAKMDKNIKLGLMDKKLALELFVLRN